MQGARRTLRERVRAQYSKAIGSSEKRFFWSLFVPVSVVYLATMSWGIGVNMDVLANSYTAWSLGTTASPIVRGYEVPESHDGYLVYLQETTDGGHISPVPPMAPLLAAPFYAVGSRSLNYGPLRRTAEEVAHLEPVIVSYPDIWPGSIAAALASAAAIGFLGLTFRQLVDPSAAFRGALVAAFGTSVWSVAADALWQHGPSLMFLSLASYLLHRDHYWVSGLAFGAALFSRQLTGAIAAAAGIALAIQLRSMRPMIRVGTASMTGLVAMSMWNLRFFDNPMPWAGREGTAERVLGLGAKYFSGEVGEVGLLENQLRGAFDPLNGFIVLSPLFLVAVLGLRRAWQEATPATRAMAIGGIIYYVIQHRTTIYAHYGYLGYRYPLEALMASAPLWFLAFRHTYRWSRLVSHAAIAASVLVHAAFAIVG